MPKLHGVLCGLPVIGHCCSYQIEGLPAVATMVQEYNEIATAFLPWVDVFLAETLSTSREAEAALRATAGLGKPIWVSLTLEDSTASCLRSKEDLSDVVAQLTLHQQHPHLAALLVNCSAPAAVAAALPVLKRCAPKGVRIGCYANGFQTTTTQWLAGPAAASLLQSNPGDYNSDGIIFPAAYLSHAKAWHAAGAQLIGGCCGVGPQHMQLVAQELCSNSQ
eukprot:gene11091-biopygen12996